ncbi:PqiC family protein [Luteibacter aegosomatis]|uniref:PqiC family protein n=1 Tax=Luteibacter aegosomatis TaxID=2911537 RepID=UPI001FF98E52|nr:PqiC family protein [Luteibacter aegosomatis]UPG86713.1 PqiC family protein [Luteibacter aegosomatis]
MNTILRLTGSAALLALAGCSSAPTHFHTLVPPATSPAIASAAFVIDVQPVNVPPQVDQPALVLRHGASGVSVMDGERWASSLGDEIRGALAADLSARLGTHDVHGLPLGKDTQVVRVQVDVRRFDSELGGNATLEAAWSVRGAKASADCASHVTQPAGGNYDSLVAAHQQAVGQLADGIAGAVRSVAAGQSPACR